jgi:predicted nucleic acid-binding protein
VRDALSDRAWTYLDNRAPTPVVSDFARAEVASAVGLRRRRHELTAAAARAVLADFDLWLTGAIGCELSTADIAVAEAMLRRLDLGLRAPDALHVAIARRLALPLATFDARLAEAAALLGVTLDV